MHTQAGIIKVGQLIDVAIGFPEAGHVNFYALHRLLQCITEKLGMAGEVVDYCCNDSERICRKELPNHGEAEKSRLIGGYEPFEKNSKETPTESEEWRSADVTLEQDLVDNDDLGQQFENATSERADNERTNSTLTQSAMEKLEERVTKIEMTRPNVEVPKDISTGISVMKDQLEFVIEQLLLLTFLTLSKKPDLKQIKELYSMAQILLEIKKDNVFIEGSKQPKLPTAPSLNWQSSRLELEENSLENDKLPTHDVNDIESTHPDALADHLCYSPSKLLDQLMELKSDFCLLTNKTNELSSRLLRQESQRTFALTQEIQEQVRDLKVTIDNQKETQGNMKSLLVSSQSTIDQLKTNIEEILEEKVDRTHFEIQLANKVDYSQLQRKASLDQILELQCRLDKRFSDILRQINENEKKFSQTVEHLSTTLGLAAINELMENFKKNIAKDIQVVHEMLNNYIALTNDDCAAAGTRTKVLPDLTCLSCDNKCVMRSMEKVKVPKLQSAHASNILSPIITYELGSIRKSGTMGYYRKDEFPHAPNAWMAHQSNTLNKNATKNAKEGIQKKVHIHVRGEI